MQNNTDNFILRARQQDFIKEMLSNPSLTIEELCSLQKISPRTYYNWKKDPEFEKEFKKIMLLINFKIVDDYSSSLVNIADWVKSSLNDEGLPISFKLKICTLITEQLNLIVSNANQSK